MPIEIKELKIKAVIAAEDNKTRQQQKISAADIERIKREIKKECIEELKQFLTDQKER